MDDVSFPLTAASSDWAAGVTFSVTTTVTAGDHHISFGAADVHSNTDSVGGGTIKVAQDPAAGGGTGGSGSGDTGSGGTGSGGTGSGDTGSGGTGSGGTGSGDTGSGGSDSGSGSTGSDSSGSGSGSAGSGSSGSGSTGDTSNTGSSGSGTSGSSGASGTSGSTSAGGTHAGSSGASSSSSPSGRSSSGAGSSAAAGSAAGPSGDGTTSTTTGAGDWSLAYDGAAQTPDSAVTTAWAGGPDAGFGRDGDALAALSPAQFVRTIGGRGDDVFASAGISSLDLGSSGLPRYVRMLAVAIGSTGSVTLMMAFLFFGKRRRDGEPTAPDEVLSAGAARMVGQMSTGALVPERPTGIPTPPIPGVNAPYDDEAAMPRWRRPSLLAARKTDPLRSAPVEIARLTFEQGTVEPVNGAERRRIRYNVVRLLDEPDELRSTEIGLLDQGDEVQLLERSGSYWLVLCPDGRRGWIHRMTLGDLVDADGMTAWESTAEDSLDDVDDDVLTAYLKARRVD